MANFHQMLRCMKNYPLLASCTYLGGQDLEEYAWHVDQQERKQNRVWLRSAESAISTYPKSSFARQNALL
jgi:hypothetical protein